MFSARQIVKTILMYQSESIRYKKALQDIMNEDKGDDVSASTLIAHKALKG